MIFLRLFWSFFQVGLFSIGGGYAAMPFIQEQAVTINGWISASEFTDLITISQMTPGPIAINAATFVGNQVAGLPGGIIATIGCIFPSCIIVLTIAYFYFKYRSLTMIQGCLKGLRPAIVALIGAAGIDMIELAIWGETGFANFFNVDWQAVILFVLSIVILRKFKTNPILVMLGCGIVSVAVYLTGAFV